MGAWVTANNSAVRTKINDVLYDTSNTTTDVLDGYVLVWRLKAFANSRTTYALTHIQERCIDTSGNAPGGFDPGELPHQDILSIE